MSELDKLTDQFDLLLEGVRGQYTLEEWRYAYRKVLYSGAMKILNDFPVIIVGKQPSPQLEEDPIVRGDPVMIGQGQFIMGERPPPHPSTICQIVCISLGC